MQKSAYERYSEIRDSLKYKDADVANGAKITRSTLSDWKAGRYVPKQDKMKKIADFLGVSSDYILKGEGSSDASKRYYLNSETAELAQKLFENKDLRTLFDAAQDATPEDLKTTYDLLMALKRKERGND